jgi:hypothetical protein
MTEDAERAVDPAEQYARANLPHLCAELLDWHRTALLRPDGHVWHLAHILPQGWWGMCARPNALSHGWRFAVWQSRRRVQHPVKAPRRARTTGDHPTVLSSRREDLQQLPVARRRARSGDS